MEPIEWQMSKPTMSTPARARANAWDRPCPRAAPVTNATRAFGSAICIPASLPLALAPLGAPLFCLVAYGPQPGGGDGTAAVEEPVRPGRVEAHRVTGAQHGFLEADFHVKLAAQDVEVLEVVMVQQLCGGA